MERSTTGGDRDTDEIDDHRQLASDHLLLTPLPPSPPRYARDAHDRRDRRIAAEPPPESGEQLAPRGRGCERPHAHRDELAPGEVHERQRRDAAARERDDRDHGTSPACTIARIQVAPSSSSPRPIS